MENQETSTSVYGDLSQFKEIVDSVDNLKNKIESIQKFLVPILDETLYDKLSLEEKVQYDLFVSYSFSSLFWMYMKTAGFNPTSSRVKAEIDRIKEHAKRFKLIKERKSMPRLDPETAGRFIRSGLWTPDTGGSKKRKRDED